MNTSQKIVFNYWKRFQLPVKTELFHNPPFDSAEIARSVGIETNFVTFKKKKYNCNILSFSDDREIFINSCEQSATWKEFAIAHELGNELLKVDSSPMKRGAIHFPNKVNQFAADLLVPKESLFNYFDKPLPWIGKVFCVPEPVIGWQIYKYTNL